MTERVKQLLKTYFLSGDMDKKNRFTGSKMLEELRKKVETGELEVDEIPKIKTIENWITRYNQEHKKESAAKELYFCRKILCFYYHHHIIIRMIKLIT